MPDNNDENDDGKPPEEECPGIDGYVLWSGAFPKSPGADGDNSLVQDPDLEEWVRALIQFAAEQESMPEIPIIPGVHIKDPRYAAHGWESILPGWRAHANPQSRFEQGRDLPFGSTREFFNLLETICATQGAFGTHRKDPFEHLYDNTDPSETPTPEQWMELNPPTWPRIKQGYSRNMGESFERINELAEFTLAVGKMLVELGFGEVPIFSGFQFYRPQGNTGDELGYRIGEIETDPFKLDTFELGPLTKYGIHNTSLLSGFNLGESDIPGYLSDPQSLFETDRRAGDISDPNIIGDVQETTEYILKLMQIIAELGITPPMGFTEGFSGYGGHNSPSPLELMQGSNSRADDALDSPYVEGLFEEGSFPEYLRSKSDGPELYNSPYQTPLDRLADNLLIGAMKQIFQDQGENLIRPNEQRVDALIHPQPQAVAYLRLTREKSIFPFDDHAIKRSLTHFLEKEGGLSPGNYHLCIVAKEIDADSRPTYEAYTGMLCPEVGTPINWLLERTVENPMD